MTNKTKQPQPKLNLALLAWCQQQNIDAAALSKKLEITYTHAWRLLAGKSPVTAETLGRIVLAYGSNPAGEIVELAGLTPISETPETIQSAQVA